MDREGWSSGTRHQDALVGQLRGHSNAIIHLAFSPDGRRLATASHDRTAKVWDANDGRVIWTLAAHTDRVNGVAFSPDGKWLATGCRDGTVKLWDASTGLEATTLHGHRGSVADVTFRPDGRRLAAAVGKRLDQAAGPPGEVRVWDVTTFREVVEPLPQLRFVYGVAFSPDGRSLATAAEEAVVRIWDAETGRETLTLHGHHDTVRRLVFHPSGRYLASAGEDRTVRVWDLTPPASPFGRVSDVGLVGSPVPGQPSR